MNSFTENSYINTFACTVFAEGRVSVVIVFETTIWFFKVVEVIAPIHKHKIRRSVITVLPFIVRCALVKKCAGEIGVGGVFHGEGEANIGWEMAEEGFIGGDFLDEIVVFEGCGADGRKDCAEKLSLLFSVLGKLRRRKFKAFVDFLKTGHEERECVWFSPPNYNIDPFIQFYSSEIEMQGFNFSKINFSAPPKAALEQGNSNGNSNGNNSGKMRRVSVRNAGVSNNVLAQYLSPIVAGPAAAARAPVWNASQAKPALSNNMQRKLVALGRSGPGYTKKNRNVFNKWNKNIEKMEKPGLFKRMFTAKKKRSATRRVSRRHRN